MKHFSFIVAFLCLWGYAAMAQNISFKFQDGLYDANLKTKMERTISALLTEFNTAHSQHRALRLDGFTLTDRAKRSLTQTWDSIASFTCNFDQNISHCLRTVTSYEIREIYVTLHPRHGNYSGALDREFSICFTSDGTITSAHMTMEDNASYRTILSQSGDVTDVARKMEILKFVEDFRSYYDEKDLKALEQIYSDDALIITGKVINSRKLGDRGPRLDEGKKIVYNKQTKEQYINSLRGIFARNKYIRVKFDDIEIMKHSAKDGFYGVTLKQNWKAMNASGGTRYEDDGYLFLLWQFREGEPPLVHVRTWQPDPYGQMKKEEVFNFNDFLIE